MALQVCKKCTTRYAPAAACPNCGADEWVSEVDADEQQAAPGSISGDSVLAGGDEDGPPDYGSLPVAVLRELARERGITQHGAKKEDLAAALAQWDAEHPDDDGEDNADGTPAGDSISGD